VDVRPIADVEPCLVRELADSLRRWLLASWGCPRAEIQDYSAVRNGKRADVPYGSKADIHPPSVMSALTPKGDMVTLMLCLGYTLAISVAERQYLRRCQHDLLVTNAWIADRD
jgi:hypothetical protein